MRIDQFDPPRSPHDNAPPAGSGEGDRRPIRVLLIEDCDDDAFLIRKYLSDGNGDFFSVEKAETLAEARRFLTTSEVPDVVLLDLSLPDSSGLKTFETLHAEWTHLPILILTGHDCDRQAIDAVQRGAQDYLVKDRMNADGLTRAIHYGIERNRIRMSLSEYTKKLQTQNQKMRFELQLAEQIQRALLPRQDSPSAGRSRTSERISHRWNITHRYLPCDDLAGDFFQVFPLENDRVGVLICDVMGHGVSSALVAALIRGLVEEDIARLNNPAELMSRLNSKLTRILWNRGIEIFASACYLIGDPVKGELSCVNAGHPAPFEIRHREKDILALPFRSDMALGIREDSSYREQTFDFRPGESLLLFTDGICEVMNQKDKFFEDQLSKNLKNHSGDRLDGLLDGLIADARKFSGSREFDDDVCLVALQYA